MTLSKKTLYQNDTRNNYTLKNVTPHTDSHQNDKFKLILYKTTLQQNDTQHNHTCQNDILHGTLIFNPGK
jgi:hypothetical protein